MPIVLLLLIAFVGYCAIVARRAHQTSDWFSALLLVLGFGLLVTAIWLTVNDAVAADNAGTTGDVSVEHLALAASGVLALAIAGFRSVMHSER